MKSFAVVFTVVKNEMELLPIWLNYYTRYFNKIVVINHHSTDESLGLAHQKYAFDEIVDDRGQDGGNRGREGDSIMAAQVANEQLKKLLNDYEIVCHAHIDEFIIPNPEKYKNLREYMEKMKKDVIYTTGYQVVHIPEEEPELDYSQPILRQRKWWTKDFAYNKPLLVKKAITWVPGIHKELGVPDEKMNTINDPDILLVHMHFADLKLFNNRSQYSGNMNWFTKYHKNRVEIPNIYKEII